MVSSKLMLLKFDTRENLTFKYILVLNQCEEARRKHSSGVDRFGLMLHLLKCPLATEPRIEINCHPRRSSHAGLRIVTPSHVGLIHWLASSVGWNRARIYPSGGNSSKRKYLLHRRYSIRCFVSSRILSSLRYYVIIPKECPKLRYLPTVRQVLKV